MPIKVVDEAGNSIEFPDGTPDHVISRVSEVEFRRLQKGNEPTSKIGSFARGLVEGGTFGFDGRMFGDDWRRDREVSKADNPITHGVGEFVGSVAPMLLTRGRSRQQMRQDWAPTIGDTAAGAASRTLSVLNPEIGRTVGQTTRNMMMAGAAQGTLSGVGHADTHKANGFGEWIGEQVKGGLQGGFTGTAFGGVLGPVVHGAGTVLRNIAGSRAAARLEADDPHQGAYHTIAKALERDNISPGDMAQHVRETSMPPPGGRFGPRSAGQWDDELVERTMALLDANPAMTPAEIRTALGNLYPPGSPQARVLPGTDAIASFLREASDRSAPLNLLDRAGMQRAGSGDNLQWTARGMAATPGPARRQFRESLVARQMDSGARVGNAIERSVGTRDFDGTAQRLSEDLERTGNAAYRRAAASEQPFDLAPVVQQHQQAVTGRRGPVPEAVTRAIDSMYSEVPIVGQGPAQGLRPNRPAAQDLPMDERLNLLEAWRFATQRIREPEGLADWAYRYVGNRGILDPGSDLRGWVGPGHRITGLANRQGGMSLDDIALRAQEEGFLRPQTPGGRVTINDLLDALHRDTSGIGRVVREADQDILDSITQQSQHLRDLRDVGITGRTEREVMEQLGIIPGRSNAPRVEQRLPDNLSDFQSARQNVRQMIQDEKNKAPLVAGERQNSPVLRALNQFYRDVTEVVAQANPEWARANALWRDGEAAREALDAGSKLALRLNATSREALTDLGEIAARAANPRLSPLEREAANSQLQLFRVGFARSLMDQLVTNRVPSHDLVNHFARPGARQIVEAVLGREDAVRFLRAVDAEAAMYRTFRTQHGSQTTPLAKAIEDNEAAPRLLAGWDYLNPRKIIEAGITHLANRYNSARNEAAMRMLTDQSPTGQLRTLRAIDGVAAARQQAGQQGQAVGLTALPGAAAEQERGWAHNSRNRPTRRTQQMKWDANAGR